jgi:hypothetical protein
MDWYSGEKTNSVDLKINSYCYVDPTRYTKPQPGEGTVRYYLYLNLDLALKAGYLTGVLRLRAVREPVEDATAYLDITVTRKDTKITSDDLDQVSDTFEWLVTHEWIGAADDDYDQLRWDIKAGPEFDHAAMTTRYAKAFAG